MKSLFFKVQDFLVNNNLYVSTFAFHNKILHCNNVMRLFTDFHILKSGTISSYQTMTQDWKEPLLTMIS